MAYDTSYYTTGYMLKDRSLNTYDPSKYHAVITATPVTSGVNLSISITNISNAKQFAPNLIVDLGWGASGTSPPLAMWRASPSFRRWAMTGQFVDATAYPDAYGEHQFPTSGAGGSLNIPALCWDNTTGCVSFASNYGHICRYRNYITSSGRYGLWMQTSYTQPSPSGSYNPPTDWLATGETVSYNIWLRSASGVVNDTTPTIPLALQQPFVSWFTSGIGNYRPPKVAGRIYGLLMSAFANQSTPQGFSTRNGVRVDTATGWAHLLNNHLPAIASLKASGYTGSMLWGLNGVDLTNNFNNYIPVVWSNLPTGLRADLPNLKKWQEDNGFDIYVWVGQAFAKSASGFAFTSGTLVGTSPPYSWISGSLTPQWDLATAEKYTDIASGFMKYIRPNIHDGPLVYCKGVGLDFAPVHSQFMAITGIYAAMRRGAPGKIIFTEGLGDCVTQAFVSTCYTTQSSANYAYKNQFDLIRCPLQEMLTSGYQNFILYQEPTQPGLIASGEAAGHCIISFSSMSNGIPSGMNTTNYPSSGVLAGRDVFTQNPLPRFLR